MNADQVTLSMAQIGSSDCPDVRSWRIGASLQRVTFAATNVWERGNVMVGFEGRDALPPAMGSQGPIAYTLWMGFGLAGVWRLLPLVECIKDYIPTDFLFAPGHVGTNLTYYGEGALRAYQPAIGEEILVFCTTGDTRRQNVQAGDAWRTNVVRVKFQVGTWSWENNAPPPPPPPPPPPMDPETLQKTITSALQSAEVVVRDDLRNLATKQDLEALRTEVKKGIADLLKLLKIAQKPKP